MSRLPLTLPLGLAVALTAGCASAPQYPTREAQGFGPDVKARRDALDRALVGLKDSEARNQRRVEHESMMKNSEQ